MLVPIAGQVPLMAAVYELERLRCSLPMQNRAVRDYAVVTTQPCRKETAHQGLRPGRDSPEGGMLPPLRSPRLRQRSAAGNRYSLQASAAAKCRGG